MFSGVMSTRIQKSIQSCLNEIKQEPIHVVK